MIVRDKIDHRKDGVLPSSKFVDLIETLGEGFHSEELAGHLWKLDLNESGTLDRFAFVRWYVVEEVYLESTEKAEHLVGWSCKVILMDLQREICLKIHALNREWEQERLSLKEGSSFQPLMQGRILTTQIQQSRERKNGLNLHPLKSIKIGG